jgi:hypothetical protein
VAPAALLAATPGAATTASAAALAGRAALAALGGAVSPHILALTKKGLQSMLPIKTKLGTALALAMALGVGLAAHQALTAQPSPSIEKWPDAPDPDTGRSGQNPRLQPSGAAPATDLDRHLADVEKRLEAALKEVRAARQALKAPQVGTTRFPLKHIDATQAVEVLRAAYPNSPMRITSDARTNVVFIQAGAADIQAIRRLLEALDGKDDAGPERIPLNNLKGSN